LVDANVSGKPVDPILKGHAVQEAFFFDCLAVESCVRSQKDEDLIYTAAEASNLGTGFTSAYGQQ
jgi:hypothetical protein